MRIGTSLNLLFSPDPSSPITALQRIKAAGFEVADMNLCDWCFPDSPFASDGWRDWIEAIARSAQEVGIDFVQAHGPIFNKFEQSDRARWLTHLSHRALQAASILGARCVVFEPQTSPGPFDESHLGQMLERNCEWFSGLLPTAEAAGVAIAIENVSDPPPGSTLRRFGAVPAELQALLRELKSPLVGICWDTGHAHMQRLDQYSALTALGPSIIATHIADNHGSADEHLLPLCGTIDWASVVRGLRDGGCRAEFVYEAHNSFKNLPDPLRDEKLRYAATLACHLLANA